MENENVQAEYLDIPLHQIVMPKYEMRVNASKEALDDLLQDIEKHGIINPITVRRINDGQYEIVAGVRRYMCAQRLRLTTVPCTLRRESGKDVEMIKIAENLKREDINPYDEGIYYQNIQNEYSLTVGEIAESSNRSKGYIQSRLDLVTGDKLLAELVRDGMLGIGVALKLNGIVNENQRAFYARHAVDSGCTLRLADLWVREANFIGGPQQLQIVPVTDPGADRQPNRLTYFCQVGMHPMKDEDFRMIECCPQCKHMVLQALEIERAQKQDGGG